MGLEKKGTDGHRMQQQQQQQQQQQHQQQQHEISRSVSGFVSVWLFHKRHFSDVIAPDYVIKFTFELI